MTEEEKQWIKSNVEKSHYASVKSRFQQAGVTREPTKINAKNFEKILEQRGLSKEERQQLLKSADRSEQMTARHAKAGEKFVTTHGIERSSGVFVSKDSLGRTPEERMKNGALPHSNNAEYETVVELTKDQDLIETKIAKQRHFQMMDPEQRSRDGGGHQVITDGGFNKDAIRQRDPKYPIAVDPNLNKLNKHNNGQSR